MEKSKDEDPDAPAATGEFSESEFKAKLREIGRHRKPTRDAPIPEGEFAPVKVSGQRLSDSVIEGRR
jgi:hypothetical protein